ncbi:glutamate--tRNA ligase, partial [Alphaproteobacteria bacterium]|nr:glutamate--tRNA ligase [Alphaproteobacteria bacterium]
KNWEYDVINSEIKDFLKQNNLKFPIIGKPVRFLLTNNYNGPSITDVFMILGKEQSIKRINKYKA